MSKNLSHDIRKLKEIYNKRKLVPFVGAGLSRPYNIPDWKRLLELLTVELVDDDQESISRDIKQGLYWDAVDKIIDYSCKDERYIQEIVVEIINKLMIKDINGIDNNYGDLNDLKVPYYLTTNYDNLLSSNIKSSYQTIILNQADVSTQQWAREKVEKRVIHLHGTVANAGSIVLSKNKYEEIYSQPKYRELFNFLRSGYTFIFLGFSFSDEYIIQLIKEYNDIFNDYHYILLPNATREIKKEYMDKYKLNVISYDVNDITNNNEHVVGIREIFQSISNDEVNKEEQIGKLQDAVTVLENLSKDFTCNKDVKKIDQILSFDGLIEDVVNLAKSIQKIGNDITNSLYKDISN